MLRSWEMNFSFKASSDSPIYLQLADSVADKVGRGLLSPGSPLPGTRTLAKSLGIHRNTVSAAYEELIAHGWAASSPSRGTFITGEIPLRRVRTEELRPRTTVRGKETAKPALKQMASRPRLCEPIAAQLYCCTDGASDVRLTPVCELSGAIRRAMKMQRNLVGADARGTTRLRSCIAEMLRLSRGIAATKEEVITTRGRQMGLYLTAQATFSQGSVIAMEQPGNRMAAEAFRLCQAEVVGVPVDREGIIVSRLQELSTLRRIDAVYVTPQHQYPTTVSMSNRRRDALLQWARQNNAVILEDDNDHEFEYAGSPLLPLASKAPVGNIIHIGSFSRIFDSSVKLGYVRASREIIHRMGEIRALIDRQADPVLESAFVELIQDGQVRRHIRKVREIYSSRRDLFAALLKREFGDRLRVEVPTGGLALWLQPEPDVNTQHWAEAAQRNGILFQPTHEYYVDGTSHNNAHGIRIGFASANENELARIATALRRSLPVSGVGATTQGLTARDRMQALKTA